jgi:hypothetical protein
MVDLQPLTPARQQAGWGAHVMRPRTQIEGMAAQVKDLVTNLAADLVPPF